MNRTGKASSPALSPALVWDWPADLGFIFTTDRHPLGRCWARLTTAGRWVPRVVLTHLLALLFWFIAHSMNARKKKGKMQIRLVLRPVAPFPFQTCEGSRCNTISPACLWWALLPSPQMWVSLSVLPRASALLYILFLAGFFPSLGLKTCWHWQLPIYIVGKISKVMNHKMAYGTNKLV